MSKNFRSKGSFLMKIGFLHWFMSRRVDMWVALFVGAAVLMMLEAKKTQ